MENLRLEVELGVRAGIALYFLQHLILNLVEGCILSQLFLRGWMISELGLRGYPVSH